MIRLHQNENPLGPTPLAKQAIARELDRLSIYPLPNGEPLTRALSTHHAIDPERIILSEGSGSISILLAIAEHCAADGGKIVFSKNGYVDFLFGHMKRCGRLTMPFDTVPKINNRHDLPALAERAQHPDTKALIVENPDNPTGSWIDCDRFAEFLGNVPEHVIVVMDGAYAEYAQASVGERYPDPAELQERYHNLIGTRTFSKAYGLAGLRVGYAFAVPRLATVLNGKRAKLSVSSTAIAAACAALQDSGHLQRTLAANLKQLDVLQTCLDRLGIEHMPSIANFVMFTLPKTDATEFSQRLAARGILVANMAAYGLKSRVRVSTGTSAQTSRFTSALEEVLADTACVQS